MADNTVERLNYFQRQYLGAQDFIDAQTYQRDMRRRHNLGPHTWGIVTGLELVERPVEGGGDARDVFILPGLAVDGYGREIILFRPLQLDPALFLRFGAANHYSVWIGYEEETANSNNIFNCEDNAFNRIVETYRIYVEPDEPQPAGVVVDGNLAGPTNPNLKIPPDVSVPYQELPGDDLALWLLPLGEVRWDGSQFLAAAEGRLSRGRRYAGLVGEALLAPAAALTIRDRLTTSLAAGDAGVAVTLEGSLQVERDITAKDDVHVDGGMIDFRQPDGSEEGLFRLKRLSSETTPGSDVQVKIGNASAGDNRFAVVSEDDKDRFVVQDDGTTTITGNTTIDGDLTVANEHNLKLDGGQLQLQKMGEATPDWGLKVSGEHLQFTEPDDGDRVVFEILDSTGDPDSPSFRLHGEAAATLSATQLIDLTDGGDTTLHTHPGATTTQKGMVEIALSSETGATGDSGARLVVAADDARLLTVTQKTDLTDGGLTTLHRHPNGILNNVRTVQLSANNNTDSISVNLGSTKRVVAFIHLRAMDPLANFDRGDGFFADIFRVDGVRPPGGSWFGGDHLGSNGSNSNLLPGLYTGLAQTITFRLRSVQDAVVWADGVVFFEDP